MILKPKAKYAIGVIIATFIYCAIKGGGYFYFGFPFMFVMIILGLKEQFFNYESKDKDTRIRGANILNIEQQNNARQSLKMRPARIRLSGSGLRIPANKETSHCFIIGCSGSGKTNVFNQILEDIRECELKAVIHDTKGDYIAKFYNPEFDYILNPLDERCVKWNIWNDIKRHSDFVTIANTLIPESSKADPFFYLTPRRILVDILQYLWDTEQTTNKAIWDIVNLPMQELGTKLLQNGLGGGNDLLGNQETASNLMSTIVNACQVFRYMQDMDGDFSVHDYIDNSSGCIFLSNKQEIKELVKPVLALFSDLSTNYLLSLPDDGNRRLFFLFDEFNSMARMSSIISLLTLARSKGGAVFIGTQDFGEIDANYGKDIRNTIINNCSNSYVLRLNDPETADYFSKKLGEVEWIDTVHSQSESQTSTAGIVPSNTVTVGTSQSRRIDRAVLPSEIMELPDLRGYVTIATVGTFASKTFYRKRDNVALPFVEKPLTRLRKPVKLEIDELE